MGLWGAVLLLPLVDVGLAVWFLAGPVVHDALLAPPFGGVGLAVARWVPAPRRTPVVVGGVLSGVLVAVAAVWPGVAAAGWWAGRRRRARGRAGE
ncbi:hypothetical protein CKY47_11520 [Saccharothrix yanglingensis]|uniref:Uncharacterized protein n=1 Tax=Saccharothrix yanglingensis TaxID=659496 RepID=A0ABU0X200_9PSEU|nr:hypothetical protein [Saccharothrix yanglingensis]